MNPAPSIIGFTTASGLGYGMVFVLALGAVLGLIPTERWFGVVSLLLALGAITAGLAASTFHLGHPERAWRAISQWRSSWLSREGLLAIVTYPPILLFAFGWIVDETMSGLSSLMAILAALGSAATVYCTGMIYASLPPIKAWHQPLTAPIYLALALMTGLLAVHALLILFGADHLVIGILTLTLVIAAALVKGLYWRKVREDLAKRPSTAGATGLSLTGLVRILDPPHTQTNYLLEEMGFQIGRKHAEILRVLCGVFGLLLPLVLTVASLLLASPWQALASALFAFISGLIGVLIERWLFFAEAEHTVMLYYGGQEDIRDQAVTAKATAKERRRSTLPAPAPMRRRAPSNSVT